MSTSAQDAAFSTEQTQAMAELRSALRKRASIQPGIAQAALDEADERGRQLDAAAHREAALTAQVTGLTADLAKTQESEGKAYDALQVAVDALHNWKHRCITMKEAFNEIGTAVTKWENE